MNVEADRAVPEDHELLTVSKRHKVNSLPDEARLLSVNERHGDAPEELNHLIVPVKERVSLIPAVPHQVGDHAHEPQRAREVVKVAVGDEDLPHAPHINGGPLKLPEDPVPAAAVGEEGLTVLCESESGVVAVCDKGTARSEHRKAHLGALPVKEKRGEVLLGRLRDLTDCYAAELREAFRD